MLGLIKGLGPCSAGAPASGVDDADCFPRVMNNKECETLPPHRRLALYTHALNHPHVRDEWKVSQRISSWALVTSTLTQSLVWVRLLLDENSVENLS